MQHFNTPTALRLVAAASFTAMLALQAGCGGGGSVEDSTPLQAADTSSSAAATDSIVEGTASAQRVAVQSKTLTDGQNTLVVQSQLPGYPHTFDVYAPAGATKVILFLHGLGGNSSQMAYDMSLNAAMAPPTMTSVNWAWLQQNHVIAIFPQATIPAGSTQTTWSDYVQKSGADDVGFLKALSAYAKSHYGATEVSISGHSDGGAMTARMWCEATASFKAFVSLAGPMPSTTYPTPAPTCTPQTHAPYYVVLGGADTTLMKFSRGVNTPTAQQMSAGLTNSILVAEWQRHHDRSQKNCSFNPVLTPTSITTYGETWSACNGQVKYTVVTKADHPIASLDQYMGMNMVDLVTQFVQ